MSTGVTWQTVSTNSAATERLGECLGGALKGGEVIELISDLGGGKTTLVRGIARGAGSDDKVASPTFTISKMYKTKHFDIHHFDFYRLHEAGIVADELAEVAGDPTAVVVVEWGDVAQHVLPAERLSLSIVQTPSGDRKLVFACPKSYNYLLEALQ